MSLWIYLWAVGLEQEVEPTRPHHHCSTLKSVIYLLTTATESVVSVDLLSVWVVNSAAGEVEICQFISLCHAIKKKKKDLNVFFYNLFYFLSSPTDK